MSEGLRLNLGCGQRARQPGWLNCDLTASPNVDVAFDALKDWPFPDHSVQTVYASHLLEHLPDPRAFFRNMWRVLRPDGTVTLRTPYGGHESAWVDIDHVRPWYPGSFAFLQPGYGASVHSLQHETWTTPYCVHQTSLRVALPYCRWLRPRWRRRWLLPLIPLIPNSFNELWVELYALKTPGTVAEFRRLRPGNAVPVRYVAYAHEWDPRAPAEPVTLVEIEGG